MKRLWNLLDKSHHELRKLNNALEIKLITLEETVKDELYKEFMKKLAEPTESKRLRKDNMMLRKRIKNLKEELRYGEGISSKSSSQKVGSKF